jgi:hypothetical protein
MRNILITLFLLYSFKVVAQSPVEAITKLADSLPGENIYIHTDKKAYLAGDTIWFKAYIYSQFAPADQSRNFYITLADAKSKVIYSKKFPIIDGTVQGDFTIDDKLPEGMYMLYAYTPRMLNREQLYTKTIPVYNPAMPFVQPLTNNTSKTVFPDDTGKKELQEGPGMVIRLFDSLGNKKFVITCKDGYYDDKDLLLLGVMIDNVAFQQKVKLKGGLLKGMIPVKDLPPGSLEVFVFEKNTLLAEGATLIANDDWIVPVKFSVDTFNLSPKGKNVFSFTLPDSIYASLSLSVTDAGSELKNTDNETILSGLFYSSGNDLFTPGHKTMIHSKKIKWDSLLNNKYPIVKFDDEGYLNIKGKVFKEGTKKIVPGGELTFFIQTRDSSQQIINSEIDKNGEFVLENMVFEDTAIFSYQLNTQKYAKQKVDIELTGPGKPISLLPVVPSIPEGEISNYIFTDLRNKEKAKVIYDSTIKNLQRSITLQGVKVIGKKKTPLQIVNEAYTYGLFADLTRSKVLDLINEPAVASARNIFEYMQGKFAGLVIEFKPKKGTYLAWSPKASSLRTGPVEAAIFINETRVDAKTAEMVSMHDVALIKYFPPNALLALGVGLAPVIAVYTKNGSEADSRSRSNLNTFKLAGYSVTKEFIAADYSEQDKTKPDNRTTILWQPNLFITPEAKKYEFSFYNSDHAKKLRITLEGFTTEGKLIHFEKIIE